MFNCCKFQINSSKPPDGFYASCLFEICFRTKKWIFCADTADDARSVNCEVIFIGIKC